MKIICSQQDFNSNLSLVGRIVPSRPTHPILANVLVIADEKKQQMTLTSFDLSVSISTQFPAEVVTGGKITLPAKLLSEIVSRLPEGEITMFYESDDGVEDNPLFTFTSVSGRFQIRAMSATEYPELPVVRGEILNLPVSTLLQGFKNAAFAASPDETKQVLTGVHLQKTLANLEFAATDGHRLAVAVQELEENLETEFSMTIPVRAFREVERILSNAQPDEQVEVYFDDTQVAFEFNSLSLTSRKLEGTYPAYDKLIPPKFSRQVIVDRKRLLKALELMAVLADQRSNLVKFTIDNKQARVALEVEAADLGNAKESLPAQINGEDLDIGFNVKYLIDGLKAFNCTDIEIMLNEANQPVIFSPLGGNKITYLVMPVQLRD